MAVGWVSTRDGTEERMGGPEVAARRMAVQIGSKR